MCAVSLFSLTGPSKVHSDKQRTLMFFGGFELDPRGNNVKLIGPHGQGMTPDQHSKAEASLNALSQRFQILPCPTAENTAQVITCHMVEYILEKGENFTIEAPYEFPIEPKESKSHQRLYIEAGLGGRDVVQTHGDN